MWTDLKFSCDTIFVLCLDKKLQQWNTFASHTTPAGMSRSSRLWLSLTLTLSLLPASRGYVARFTATSSPSSRVKSWSCLTRSSDTFTRCPSPWGDRSLRRAPCPSCSAGAGRPSAASPTATREAPTPCPTPWAASQPAAPTRPSKPQELPCSAATSPLRHLCTELIPSTASSRSHRPHHRRPSRPTTTSRTTWPITPLFCITTWTSTDL